MRKLILITALALGTTAARADNGFWYLGAGVVRSSVTNIELPEFSTPDIKSTSWKAYGGVRPLKWLAGELDYIDLGSSGGNEYPEVDGKAVAAYAVGFLPIPLPVVDVFGKVGLASTHLYGTYHPNCQIYCTSSGGDTDFAWGAGVQAHISMVGVRFEYEGFKVRGSETVPGTTFPGNSSDARVVSLSVLFSF